ASRSLAIRAAGIQWKVDRWELLPMPGRGVVEVDVGAADGQGVTRHLTARSGGLQSRIARGRSGRQVTVTLGLKNWSGRLRPSDPAGEQESLEFTHLTPKDDPLPALLRLQSRELLAEADRRASRYPDAFISAKAEELRGLLAEIGREIVSKYH